MTPFIASALFTLAGWYLVTASLNALGKAIKSPRDGQPLTGLGSVNVHLTLSVLLTLAGFAVLNFA